MKTVTINNFSGGLAEDLREQKSNTFSTCKGFDSVSKPNTLIPQGELEAEALTTGDIKDKLFSDVVLRDTFGYIYAVGRNSAGTPTTFDIFIKASDTNIASTYASATSLAGAGGYKKNSFISYKAKFYVLDATFGVRRYDGSWTTVGALDVTANWSNALVPKPIIHSADDILYLAGNQSLAKVDGTTYSDITTVSVPTNLYISSLAEYNSYLAMATTPSFDDGSNSRVFLWNRDTSVSTFTENIDWGTGKLLILENIGGTLVGISTKNTSYENISSYDTTKDNKIIIKALSGNQVITIKEFSVASNFELKNIKATKDGRLYFGGDNDDSLYCVYKNRQGAIVCTKSYYIANGTTATVLRGFNIFGDYLFTMYDTANATGLVSRTKVTSSYTDTAVYESLINPNMEIGDRSKRKKLVSVSIAKSSTTGALTVYYKVDGGSYNTIGTLSASGSLVLKATNESSGKPMEEGYEYQFKVESTSGAEFTELKYNYEVVNELI